MSYVVVKDVNVIYDGASQLNDVNVQISQGEIVAILGPSGFGKTTLLRVMTGLQIPSNGEVRIDGIEASEALRQGRIAVSLQDATLLPWLNSRDNAGWFRKMRTGVLPVRDIERLELLLRIDLSKKSLPRKLSGGERQRIGLMRALTMDASFLAMDESFSALDYEMRRTFLGELRNRLKSSNTTTAFVTHDVRDAVHLADRIIISSITGQKFDREVKICLGNLRESAVRERSEFNDLVNHINSVLEAGG